MQLLPTPALSQFPLGVVSTPPSIDHVIQQTDQGKADGLFTAGDLSQGRRRARPNWWLAQAFLQLLVRVHTWTLGFINAGHLRLESLISSPQPSHAVTGREERLWCDRCT